MKRFITIVPLLILILSFAGCGAIVSGIDVYAFPEPAAQIVVSYGAQGSVTEYTIIDDTNNPSTQSIMKWFYELKLKECDKPEDVDGNESFSFTVNGNYAFFYDDRGETAFVAADDKWYEVKNPTTPPISK